MRTQKPIRSRVRTVAAALAFLTLSCRASVADLATASVAPTPRDPVEVVLVWLAAVRAKDAGKLASLSHAPFVESRLRADKCALKGKAQTTEDVAKLAVCIVEDSYFVEAIPDTTVKKYFVEWKVVALSGVKKSLRKFVAPLAKSHELVSGFLTGDGLNYDLVLAVRRDGGGVDAAVAEVDAFE